MQNAFDRSLKAQKRIPAFAHRAKAGNCFLWHVEPERRHEHIFSRVWSSTHPAPDIAVDVGVLRSPLNPALRAGVKAIPEPDRAFNDVARISVAVRQPAGIEPVG